MGAHTTHTNIWKNALIRIRKSVSEREFEQWFKPIVPIKYDPKEKNLKIQVPSYYFYEYLEENYLPVIKDALYSVIGKGAKLTYKIQVISKQNSKVKAKSVSVPENSLNHSSEMEEIPSFKAPVSNPMVLPGLKKYKIKSQLNSKFTFDNFVVGKCNKIAYTLAQKIAENPGNFFNPFFIFGPIGVGKTHLVQAIGNKMNELFPDMSVVYVNAYTFQMQYTSSVQKNEVNDFLNFYQNIDVLIIDDIQELSNKEQTQKNFFNIFNTLAQRNKQIIISSDRPPAEFKGMQERLISRFASGVIAELHKPDFEVRLEILRRLAKKEGLEISERVLRYIAENVKDNIRELEGVLISLLAYSITKEINITIDFVRSFIKNIVKKRKSDVTISRITKVVADVLNIDEKQIRSKKRTTEVVLARQLSMYFAKKYTNMTAKSIGKEIGNKDHATVLYSIKVIENLLETDNNVKNYVEKIDSMLNY